MLVWNFVFNQPLAVRAVGLAEDTFVVSGGRCGQFDVPVAAQGDATQAIQTQCVRAGRGGVRLTAAPNESIGDFFTQDRRVFQNVCLGMVCRLASGPALAFVLEAFRRFLSREVETVLVPNRHKQIPARSGFHATFQTVLQLGSLRDSLTELRDGRSRHD